MLLHPNPTVIDGVTYVLHKFPATVGREILMQYPASALPKIGDYKTNHALMMRIMAFVGVSREDGSIVALATEALVNNHVEKTETLIKLEWAMIQYNFDFFTDGRSSKFLALVTQHLSKSASETLMKFVQSSSAKN